MAFLHSHNSLGYKLYRRRNPNSLAQVDVILQFHHLWALCDVSGYQESKTVDPVGLWGDQWLPYLFVQYFIIYHITGTRESLKIQKKMRQVTTSYREEVKFGNKNMDKQKYFLSSLGEHTVDTLISGCLFPTPWKILWTALHLALGRYHPSENSRSSAWLAHSWICRQPKSLVPFLYPLWTKIWYALFRNVTI